MDRINQLFLNILKVALKGDKLPAETDITPQQWGDVMRLARIHNVLPLVYNAVFSHPTLTDGAKIRSEIRQLVMMQTVKTNDFLQLYSQLKSAGCTPLVVKGLVCRSLYPQPDLRMSTDEDLLIPADQFDTCYQVFREYGLNTEISADQFDSEYEIPFRKADGVLYIELHKSLFPPQSDAYGDWNRFFDGAGKRAVKSGEVYTLGHTDHLFYLICHSFKHFIHSGFGIRQLCDIAMYANAYGQQIDWDKIYRNCCEINARTFAATLFVIAEKYLVFDAEKACYPQYFAENATDETNMLNDLLSAGVFGGATMSRKHSSNMTLDAVAADKQGKKAGKSLKNTLFPSAKRLKGRYTYLEKRPYLLPVAWASRVGTYLKETDRNNSTTETLKIGSERVDLLREYKVIK